MPVTGRKPKPPGESVHRGKPAHEWTEVDDVPFTEAPVLPAVRSNGHPWPEWTARKWQSWSTMPHCTLWTESDWDFAFDSLEVAARFHEGGSAALAAELRTRERLLGTTVDFRRDLRIRYVQPKQVVLATVIQADDFRNL